MKRDKHAMDTFFKEALQGHRITPSEKSRQRFLREVSTMEAKQRRTRLGRILLLSLVIITGITAIFLLIRHNESPVPQPAANPEKTVTAPEPVKVPASHDAVMASSGKNPQSFALSPGTGSFQTTHMKIAEEPNSPPEQGSGPDAGTSFSATQPAEQREALLASMKSLGIVILPDTNMLQIPGDTLGIPLNMPDSLIPEKSREKNQKSSEWLSTVSLSYTPEWLFNTLEGTKYINNAGIEGTFRYRRFSVRTGVGLTIHEGSNEMVVEYNEYLGSYQKLDSMDFHWDENHYHLIPDYYLSNQHVWDSLIKKDYPKVIKRYTYIQIPMILGYDLIRKKSFTMGIRAGQILSILAGSKQISPEYDPGRNRILQMNLVTADRIETNWQLIAAWNASFIVSRRIILEIEPTFRYYFNSVYEQAEINNKVWSVGFRAAVSFKF